MGFFFPFSRIEGGGGNNPKTSIFGSFLIFLSETLDFVCFVLVQNRQQTHD